LAFSEDKEFELAFLTMANFSSSKRRFRALTDLTKASSPKEHD